MRFPVPFPVFLHSQFICGVEAREGKALTSILRANCLFAANERKHVITSTICWCTMIAILIYLSFVVGTVQMIKLYAVPYWIFVMWLDLVTYLHHHGYEQKLPWYRGKEWSYLRGGLTTVDRDYGIFNNIHHDIGTHVTHHLFPQIPHYHLVEAVYKGS